MDKFRQEVVTIVRSVLASTKGSCTVKQLKTDYRMLMGCDIPYHKLKFDSAEAFLRSESTLECKAGPEGLMVNARIMEKSAHIARMVSAQKMSSRKRSKRVVAGFSQYRPGQKQTHQSNQGYKGRYANNNHSGSHNTAGPTRHAIITIPPKRSPPLVNNNNNNVYGKSQKPNPSQSKQRNTNPTYRSESQQENTYNRESIQKQSSQQQQDSNERDKQVYFPGEMPYCLTQQVPYSAKTNRAMLLNQQGSSISSIKLKNEGLKANPDNSVLAFSISDSGKDRLKEAQPTKAFESTGDPIIDLQNFLEINKRHPAEITILKRQAKFRKNKYFDCKVVAGGKTFSSYPNDFTNEEEVRKFTCEKALNELIPLLLSASPKANLFVSDNTNVLERLPAMIEQHSNGIWKDQLERLYVDKFKEILPTNWLQIIENSPVISIQQAGTTNKTLHLLTHCRPEDKGKFSDVQKNRLEQYLHSTVSVAANQLLNISAGANAVVEVQCVESAGEIWCKVTGTNEADQFAAMNLALMRTFLDDRLLSTVHRPECVLVGGHYAVLHGDVACRVQVLHLNAPADDKAVCFYVDYGDVQEVNVNDISTLDETFATIQAQAFQCRLAGLEDFYEHSNESDALMDIVGNEYYLEVSEEINGQSTSETDEVLNIYLYDMETDVNINEILENQLMVESAVPYLSDTAIMEVVVTNVEDNGDIFVQVQQNKPGFNKLMELQGKFNDAISKNESWVKSLPTINKETCGNNKIFIAYSNKDKAYYRASVNDWEPSGRFLQILFIDFGYTDIIKLSEAKFYDVNQFSEILQDFEAQAVRVKLDINEVPEHFKQVFAEIVGNSNVLAKLVRLDKDQLPIMKLFKRVLPDNLLASISETIIMNYEKRPEKPTVRELLRTKKNPPSSGELKSPEIPIIGSFFDVNIPTAVSPWNFFIQPWKSNLKLEKLMESLQQRYNTEAAQYSPLSLDDIIPGKVYASKHPPSGVWHRTSVTKVINPHSIAVYYVDYGYYDNLQLNQLLPLDSESLELPCQAIKAKLTGVKPKNNKWTVDDCDFFRKLVTGKQFVSVIEDAETDEFCPSDVVMCLRLVNTRGDQDIHIGDVLIQKDIAVAFSKFSSSSAAICART